MAAEKQDEAAAALQRIAAAYECLADGASDGEDDSEEEVEGAVPTRRRQYERNEDELDAIQKMIHLLLWSTSVDTQGGIARAAPAAAAASPSRTLPCWMGCA